LVYLLNNEQRVDLSIYARPAANCTRPAVTCNGRLFQKLAPETGKALFVLMATGISTLTYLLTVEAMFRPHTLSADL